MPPKVYVIIVTYNAMKWVDKCFTSLRNSSVKVFPVVVDNLSKDETVMYIKENYPEVYVIENKDNRGFGQANNQGIEYAYKQGATHFFLLNQDAWVYPETIKRLISVQDEFGIGIVSPIHLNGAGDMLDYNFYNYFNSYQSVSRCAISSLQVDNKSNDKYFSEVGFVNAAAWMISRYIIEVIGGFDPLFFHYGEDVNYCQRMRYHKEKIAIILNSFIHHDRGIAGNLKVRNERFATSSLLNAYADVNQNNIQVHLKLHMWLIKQFLVGLFHFNLNSLFSFLKAYAFLLSNVSRIRKSVHINRLRGCTWLQLGE